MVIGDQRRPRVLESGSEKLFGGAAKGDPKTTR
jgi:hypothetical protein